MADLIFVEQLDEHGRVTARHRLDQFPATIGRDYHNAVILDDDAVSPLHLSISLEGDGTFSLLDCDSENGVYRLDNRGRPRERVRDVTLQTELTLQLGESHLRLRTLATTLPPTRILSRPAIPGQLLNWSGTFALLFVLTLGLAGLVAWYGQFDTQSWAPAVSGLVPLLVGIPAWAAVWAVLGRIFVGRGRFFAHGSLACLGMAALAVESHGAAVLAFAFNTTELASWMHFGLVGLGAGLLVALHLLYASRLRKPALWKAGIAACILAWSGWLLAGYLSANDDNTLDIDTTLLPPTLRLSPAHTLDQFLTNSAALEKDAFVAEEP